MGRIQERFGRQQFVFIDDSLKNLKELDFHFNRNHKVLALGLAAWGYLGAEDSGRAPDSGFQALQQTDVIKLIKDAV